MTWPAPPETATAAGRLVPLTTGIVEADTAAYRASPVAIRAHSGGRWPEAEGFTVEENLPLIRQHEAEHSAGEAFAYAILGPGADADHEIGCAYLRPLQPFLTRTGTRLALGEPADDLAILTYWLVDARTARSATDCLRLLASWVQEWGAARTLLRCLPDETEHTQAAQALSLEPVPAEGQSLPYRWFRIPAP